MSVSGTQSRTSRLRRGHQRDALESAGMMRWLLTYADMITLLLALFIILFAISNISYVKFQRLAKQIAGGFSSTDTLNNPPNGGTTGTEHGRTAEANMGEAKFQLDQYIAKQKLQSKVQTHIDKQGLVITLLSDKAYYSSGSAELRPETKQLLDVVARQLASVRNDVRVEGSTDDIPIATAEYPTNWELSAARSTGVTRYLVEHDEISPTRISFAGYGQFRPRFTNDSEAHRQQNRRVDIVILNGAQTEDNALPTGPTSSQQHPHGWTASQPQGRSAPAIHVQRWSADTARGHRPRAAASRPDRNVVARSDRGTNEPGGAVGASLSLGPERR